MIINCSRESTPQKKTPLIYAREKIAFYLYFGIFSSSTNRISLYLKEIKKNNASKIHINYILVRFHQFEFYCTFVQFKEIRKPQKRYRYAYFFLLKMFWARAEQTVYCMFREQNAMENSNLGIFKNPNVQYKLVLLKTCNCKMLATSLNRIVRHL